MYSPFVAGFWSTPPKPLHRATLFDPRRAGIRPDRPRTSASILKIALVCSAMATFLGFAPSARAGTTQASTTPDNVVRVFDPAAVPVNDNFGNSSLINLGALPFTATVDVSDASTEPGEPFPCVYSYQTIWYKLVPTNSTWFSTNTFANNSYGAGVNVYRDMGSGLYGLSFITCTSYASSGTAIFLAQAGGTYYLQVVAPCCGYYGSQTLSLNQVAPPVPIVDFSYYPSYPSSFDVIQFYDNSTDPGQVGIGSRSWDFGDGSRDTTRAPQHRYAADGSYTVTLIATTYDGRTGSASQTVNVKTHDVAITKFQTPNSGSVGQTRHVLVGIRNTRYPETVEVRLYKSVPGGYQGFQQIGFLDQFVPVRASNRTTDFDFSYTFSGDDAVIGKVSFEAFADILNANDALPADNQAISLPTKVSGSGGTGGSPAAAIGGRDTVSADQGAPGLLGPALRLLRVTPNPAHAGVELSVQLSLPVSEPARLQVLDLAGRIVLNSDLASRDKGFHEIRLAWERRPAPGTYWVRLSQGGKFVSTPVVILE
jgi:PKD repeat protein